MISELLLNDKPLHFPERDLPCLITYKPHLGRSHFSVALIAQMAMNGSRVLFLTAYHMATDELLKMVDQKEA